MRCAEGIVGFGRIGSDSVVDDPIPAISCSNNNSSYHTALFPNSLSFSLSPFSLTSPPRLYLQLEFVSPMATVNRWIRPEVYPLFAAVGVAVGICGFQLVRNICINPEVRVNKESRAAGVLDNHDEGKKYADHGLRHFVRTKSPEIMPNLNKFFTEPK
ncbi:hypothetical protein LUZ60_000269 [Juncus effusus]|nr:hypothetical protein LUZ60_000269 [Juncus effusus]